MRSAAAVCGIPLNYIHYNEFKLDYNKFEIKHCDSGIQCPLSISDTADGKNHLSR